MRPSSLGRDVQPRWCVGSLFLLSFLSGTTTIPPAQKKSCCVIWQDRSSDYLGPFDVSLFLLGSPALAFLHHPSSSTTEVMGGAPSLLGMNHRPTAFSWHHSQASLTGTHWFLRLYVRRFFHLLLLTLFMSSFIKLMNTGRSPLGRSSSTGDRDMATVRMRAGDAPVAASVVGWTGRWSRYVRK